MQHRFRKSLPIIGAFIAGAAATTMIGASVFTQPAEPDDNAMPMDPEAMERWAAVSTPGEQHAELVSSSGNWTVTSRMWMDPNGEPETSELRSVITPELVGRFVSERLTGQIMGMPYEGYGIFGYDNHKSKWTSTWMDNMNTAMIYAEGEETEDGTIELFGEMYDPMADAEFEIKLVLWEEGPDVHFMTMHSKVDGEWIKGMEMEYRRADRRQGDRPGARPQGNRPR